MTLQEFINANNGKGLDFDGAYGYQCVDLAQFWSRELGGPRFTGNAKDIFGQAPAFYDSIPNTPSGVPQAGDIMIWGTKVGPYGHIAVFIDGDVNRFRSFDQNWPVGSICHVQSHDYFGVVGWLRKKGATPPPPPPPPPVLPPVQKDYQPQIDALKAEMVATNTRINELVDRVNKAKLTI